MTKQATKTTQPTYQSNPFALSFDKFGQFFEKNLGWAIALIIFPIFGFFFQMMVGALDAATAPDTNAYSIYSQTLDTVASTDPATISIAIFAAFLAMVFMSCIVVASIAIETFISGLFTYAALENESGRTANFSKAIDAVVARFWRLFMARLLASVKIFGWTLLFIIPGIVAIFRYALLPFVIMDEPSNQKGVKASHDRVKSLVAGRKREVFGVATVASIIPFIGSVIQFVGNAALYRQLQVFNDNKLEKGPVHWLNYFGFVLIGLYLLLLLFILSLVMIAVSLDKF